jgi:uracil-DNA glycosylase
MKEPYIYIGGVSTSVEELVKVEARYPKKVGPSEEEAINMVPCLHTMIRIPSEGICIVIGICTGTVIGVYTGVVCVEVKGTRRQIKARRA